MTVLKQGSLGAEVRELQRLLAVKGLNVPDTGEYGPETAAAVRAAQARFGLVTIASKSEPPFLPVIRGLMREALHEGGADSPPP